MINKILVAYDGTDCADRALLLGLDVAEKYSASMQILNVVELPVFGSPQDPIPASVNMAGFVKELRESHQAILAKAKEKAAQAKPNINVVTELREGDPPAQIVAAATEYAVDLIVMGHGGTGRLRELFLGGVSERVAHMARCAVLIVK